MLIYILCAVSGLAGGAALAGLVFHKETRLLLRENRDLRFYIKRKEREWAERDILEARLAQAEKRYWTERNLNRSKNAAGANPTAKDG